MQVLVVVCNIWLKPKMLLWLYGMSKTVVEYCINICNNVSMVEVASLHNIFLIIKYGCRRQLLYYNKYAMKGKQELPGHYCICLYSSLRVIVMDAPGDKQTY